MGSDIIYFGPAEIKLSNLSLEFSKVVISTNQNLSLHIRKFFYSFLMATKQNRAFTQIRVFKNFDVKKSESSNSSQVKFVVLTSQKEVLTDFKTYFKSEQNDVYETSQSTNFSELCSNITKRYFRHQSDVKQILLSGLY